MSSELPTSFDNADAAHRVQWPSQDWYRGFSSDQLNSLVEQAAAHNWDLIGARAQIVQADARARQAGAALLPSVDLTANANVLAGHSAGGSGHETDWSALLSASYEIDFWGKNRAVLNSATSLAVASRAQRDTLALTTLAGVANGYFQVLALRERLTLARSNFQASTDLLKVVQLRYGAGLAGPGELALQRAAAAAAAAVIPELEQQESEGRAALALLLGRAPEGFDVKDRPLESLTEPSITAGMPAELLTRRPDVFVAEANLLSAHADIAAARAAMLPGVSLTAGAGAQNPALNAAMLTIPGAGATVALGASVAQAIFNHGRLRAVSTAARARQDEFLAAYRGALDSALVDVENALSAIRHLDAARPYQTEALAQSERAFDSIRRRYQAGAGDYLSLLEAQRSQYSARDQFLLYELARLRARVSLCKALGGGWIQPT